MDQQIAVEIQAKREVMQKAKQRAATAANQAKCAALRQSAYDEAYVVAKQVLQDEKIRDFVVLYLAEGYRKDKNVVSFGNSNPNMIRFAYHCMKQLSTNPRFGFSFQYHADQDLEELKRFWGTYLDIDPELIKAIPKTNSGHLKGRRFACEYGVFQVRVSDTYFRSRLQALMDVVQAQWATPTP